MKNTLQKNLINALSIVLLTNTFVWCNYYLGVKPGNYILISSCFLFSVLINTIATNKSKTGSKKLLVIIVVTGALGIPFLGDFAFLSLYLVVLALLTGFLKSFDFSGKRIAELILIVLSPLFLSLVVPIEFLKILNVLLPLLAIGAMLSVKFRFIHLVTYLFIISIGILNSLEMMNKKFFDNEPLFKGEIVLRETLEDSVYTLTHTKGDWLLFRGKDQMLSSADYFMFYESLVHSAFYYNPQAKDILIVSPYALFFLEELNAFPNRNVSWINEEKEMSGLVNRIVRRGMSPEVDFDVLLDTNRKFDLIILDKGEVIDPYIDMLNQDGIIVKIFNDPIQKVAPKNFASKDFHIALPTDGEHYWKIYARDSLSIDGDLNKNFEKTDFFKPEVMKLITNSGKFY